MSIQINTFQILNRLWLNKLNNLIVMLLLVSQFVILEHSTEHFFHVHNDYCLTFQTADASPALIIPTIQLELPERYFEAILIAQVNSIIIPLRKYYSTRAPPFFI
ncbi:hypothetical protein [sulfur-oxidizing endosymbiont of Gigantopelta aegis]|uniref:hypothetical protein n=1 Tax=sulfur-oxidizing endosymbiont of Gigantopelta aegis TaxID=2794934 RepID=UPI001BE469BE|nr:hypothetical protein [sulfur-oxidizing endosymbiont of Gigantopelta aegis]